MKYCSNCKLCRVEIRMKLSINISCIFPFNSSTIYIETMFKSCKVQIEESLAWLNKLMIDLKWTLLGDLIQQNLFQIHIYNIEHANKQTKPSQYIISIINRENNKAIFIVLIDFRVCQQNNWTTLDKNRTNQAIWWITFHVSIGMDVFRTTSWYRVEKL